MVSFPSTRWLALALVVGLAAGSAQAAPAGRTAFRTYGTRQGLTTLSVEHLIQDRRGFIWAGTQNGAFRFDGHSFGRFGRGEGLPSAAIEGLVRGEGDDVWICTTQGVARWDGRRMQEIPLGGGQPMRCNGVERAGGRVFAALQAGLYRQA